VNAIFIIKNFLGVITLLLTWLLIMTGTGGGLSFLVSSYTLAFVRLLWGIFEKYAEVGIGLGISKNYKMFVWIRDIGRGRLR
jgi:hypothetical protein